MKIEPLKQYKEPRFPTCEVLEDHPELLAALPARWKVNSVVLAALSGVCMLISTSRVSAAAYNPVYKVAPMFEHGSGHGSYGCMVVNPPIYLSEQDARLVIQEEAAKLGIVFEQDLVTLPNVAVPVTYCEKNPRLLAPRATFSTIPEFPDRVGLQLDWVASDEPPPTSQVLPLTLDGTSMKNRVSYEFVSVDDVRNWHYKGMYSGRNCSAGCIDTFEAALKLSEGLQKAKLNGHCAVFYDPMVSVAIESITIPQDGSVEDQHKAWQKEFPQKKQEAAESEREQLRLQVRDFVKWLKAEGVI